MYYERWTFGWPAGSHAEIAWQTSLEISAGIPMSLAGGAIPVRHNARKARPTMATFSFNVRGSGRKTRSAKAAAKAAPVRIYSAALPGEAAVLQEMAAKAFKKPWTKLDEEQRNALILERVPVWAASHPVAAETAKLPHIHVRAYHRLDEKDDELTPDLAFQFPIGGPLEKARVNVAPAVIVALATAEGHKALQEAAAMVAEYVEAGYLKAVPALKVQPGVIRTTWAEGPDGKMANIELPDEAVEAWGEGSA